MLRSKSAAAVVFAVLYALALAVLRVQRRRAGQALPETGPEAPPERQVTLPTDASETPTAPSLERGLRAASPARGSAPAPPPPMPPAPAGRHRSAREIARRIAVDRKSVAVFAVTALAVLALVALPVAFGGPGGNGKGKGGGNGGGGANGGSLTLKMAEGGDMNGNGAPNYKDTVTFDVSTTAEKPYVNVRCYQGTAFVYDSWAGFYAGAWFGQNFTLSSSYWTPGAADCTARLVTWSNNGREQTLATMGFPVGA